MHRKALIIPVVALLTMAFSEPMNDERLPPPMSVPGERSPNLEPVHGAGASFAEQVVELINVERLNNGGLAPLKVVPELTNASQDHSENMGVRDFFAHCDVDTGLDPFQRMTNAGYNFAAAAENIAAGQSTAAAVVAGWMGSPGHRTNILNPVYRETGVGFYFDSGDQNNVRLDSAPPFCVVDGTTTAKFRYWTQNFGSRNGVFPLIINREAFETNDVEVDLFIYGQGSIVDMRLRNDAGTFTPWMPFSENLVWELSPVDGERVVEAELRNGAMQVFTASDTILLSGFFSCVMPGNFPMWPAFDIRTFIGCISP